MGKTQVSNSGFRSRSGNLPGGTPYTSTRSSAGKHSKVKISKNKTLTKGSAIGSNAPRYTVSKEGNTPGGRMYEASKTKTGKVGKMMKSSTTVNTNSGRTSWSRDYAGGKTKSTAPIEKMKRVGSYDFDSENVKKGPTKPLRKKNG